MISFLRQDFQQALRRLPRHRRFALAVVLVLAVCLGINSAIFAVVESVLLNPLDLPEPDQLIVVTNSYPGAGLPDAGASYPDYLDRKASIQAFESVGLALPYTPVVEVDGIPERIQGMVVTSSLFRLLKASPRVGRLFSEAEEEPARSKVVILGHGFWRRAFGGNEDVLGQTLRISSEAYEIVGVMPEGFRFLERETQVWVPAAATEAQQSDARRHSNTWKMVGRLAPGASLEAASDQITALNATNLERFPHFREVLEETGFTTRLIPLAEYLEGDVRDSLVILWSGALFVLLLGCLNLSSLALAQADARAHESAVRLALGSSRLGLARAFVTENLILAGCGCVLGLVLSGMGLRVFERHLRPLHDVAEISFHWQAAVWTAGLALLAALILSLLPCLYLLRGKTDLKLDGGGRSQSSPRKSRWIRHGLVIGQVTLAFLLLTGATTAFSNFARVLRQPTGFEAEDVLTASISFAGTQHQKGSQRDSLMRSLLENVISLSGIEQAGASSRIPMGPGFSDSPKSKLILGVGQPVDSGSSLVSPALSVVTPGYFEAMGIGIQKGRAFGPSDTKQSAPVVIVDHLLARSLARSGEVLGRQLYFPSNPEDLQDPGPPEERMTVVGIVDAVNLTGFSGEQSSRVGAYYLPYSQMPLGSMTLAARSKGDPESIAAALRQALRRLDPRIPLFDVQPMEQRVEDALGQRSLVVVLAACFSGLSLALAMLGLYGTLAVLVSSRRKELGIRLALGSGKRRVVALVLREGLLILTLGLFAGVLGALVLSQALAGRIGGISANPQTLLAAAVFLALAGLLACWLPARRAARTNPLETLQAA